MAISFLVWTLILLLDVASLLINRAASPEWFGPLPPLQAVLLRAVTWYSWWLWTPAIFYLAHRFRFDQGARVRSFAVHALSAFVIVQVNGAMEAALRSSMSLSTSFRVFTMSNMVQYAAVCGAAVILDLRRRERASLLAHARLESQLSHARMQAFTAQLRPHFLYNALNSVAMLIRARSHDEALESVLGYSDLLRHVLDADRTEIPLQEELAFVERYLAIERMRFSERLSATVNAEPGIGDALVPNLMLQPLVENALHHGLASMERNARLEVVVSQHGDMLRLEVRDNGAGLPGNWRLEASTGVGLQSTRTRLSGLYGDTHHFELHSPADGGTIVIVEIPFRTAAVAVA